MTVLHFVNVDGFFSTEKTSLCGKQVKLQLYTIATPDFDPKNYNATIIAYKLCNKCEEIQTQINLEFKRNYILENLTSEI